MANKEMRVVLAEGLASLMRADKRIIVIDADLGRANGTLALRKEFPERAFDVGIAEQNMASVAAGMAAGGATVFINSFTPFVTRRICDQIAVSISYAKRNVKIIGTDPGLAAELNGATHMSVEDIGVLRSIPDIVIFEVTDEVQLAAALPVITAYNGPVYIRLFRKLIDRVFDPDTYQFDLKGVDLVKAGKDVTIFASGLMVQESVKAIAPLKEEGISVELINVHTIKPIDVEAVVASARKTNAVVTCENHNIIGGLGSAVAETLAKNYPTPMEMIGIQDRFGQVGYLPFLKEEYSMDIKSIIAAVKKVALRK